MYEAIPTTAVGRPQKSVEAVHNFLQVCPTIAPSIISYTRNVSQYLFVSLPTYRDTFLYIWIVQNFVQWNIWVHCSTSDPTTSVKY